MGLRSATLTITDNGSGSPQSVTLSGTGETPVVKLSTAALTFAAQTVETTSPSQPVTVTNSGPGTLVIKSIAFTGANPGDFAQTGNCPADLAVNAACTINVTFTPTATGSRTASMTITDNGSGSPQSVSLTGTGQ
ncbi:MAG TPA: choice-of-anchor D domain-containing protein [Bryobacteraceae bacterium]